MEKETFQAFQEIAYDRAGIFLREGKSALVQARLAKRLRELGLSSEREYLARLRGEDGGDEIVLFLDAISTNFTKFFREPDHFESLVDHVRALRSAGQRRFRFWSAACSSGEEAYTAAMVLDPLLEGCDWRILATDISTRVLGRAADGVYGDDDVEPVPEPQRSRFLQPAHPAADGSGCWAVKPRLREHIVFRRLNLAARPYPMSGPLDAIFCRNVMIYFDLAMREGMIEEFERLLRPRCPLYVGHSETLNGIRTRLRSERPSVYRLPEEAR
jgi:chemotaxis protein methyltransferase CheR